MLRQKNTENNWLCLLLCRRRVTPYSCLNFSEKNLDYGKNQRFLFCSCGAVSGAFTAPHLSEMLRQTSGDFMSPHLSEMLCQTSGDFMSPHLSEMLRQTSGDFMSPHLSKMLRQTSGDFMSPHLYRNAPPDFRCIHCTSSPPECSVRLQVHSLHLISTRMLRQTSGDMKSLNL